MAELQYIQPWLRRRRPCRLRRAPTNASEPHPQRICCECVQAPSAIKDQGTRGKALAQRARRADAAVWRPDQTWCALFSALERACRNRGRNLVALFMACARRRSCLASKQTASGRGTQRLSRSEVAPRARSVDRRGSTSSGPSLCKGWCALADARAAWTCSVLI